MAILSWVQGLGCLTVSVALLYLSPDLKNWNGFPPLSAYSSVGMTTTLGPSFGYSSLRNINYAAQVCVACMGEGVYVCSR